MKKYLIILFIISNFPQLFSQVKLISCNIENFGESKSDSTIVSIVSILREYDIVAIQEVVAGKGGPQTVARLVDELSRTGDKWDYTVSDPTSSSVYKTERYAFLWKNKTIKKVGEAWLEKKYNLEIDREPYYCTFQYKKKQFSIVN